jgi:hypothetical protein
MWHKGHGIFPVALNSLKSPYETYFVDISVSQFQGLYNATKIEQVPKDIITLFHKSHPARFLEALKWICLVRGLILLSKFSPKAMELVTFIENLGLVRFPNEMVPAKLLFHLYSASNYQGYSRQSPQVCKMLR